MRQTSYAAAVCKTACEDFRQSCDPGCYPAGEQSDPRTESAERLRCFSEAYETLRALPRRDMMTSGAREGLLHPGPPCHSSRLAHQRGPQGWTMQSTTAPPPPLPPALRRYAGLFGGSEDIMRAVLGDVDKFPDFSWIDSQ